jgi:hypothetical protein
MTRLLVKPHVNTELSDRSLRLAFLYTCREEKWHQYQTQPFFIESQSLLPANYYIVVGIFSLLNLVQPEDGLIPAETCSCNKDFNKQCG